MKTLSVSNCEMTLGEIGALCSSLSECSEDECPVFDFCTRDHLLANAMPRLSEQEAEYARQLLEQYGNVNIHRGSKGDLIIESQIPQECFTCLCENEKVALKTMASL